MAEFRPLKIYRRERTGKETSRKLRRQGLIPAVVYGPGMENMHISVELKELEKIARRWGREVLFVELLAEDGRKFRAVLQDLQFHPVTDAILHADFYCIEKAGYIEVEVPLKFVGTPVGLKKGGLLEILEETLTVKAPVDAIPDHIEVDISELDIGDALHVAELKMPERVVPAEKGDILVVTVVAEKAEEEEEEKPEETPPAA